MLFDSFGFFFRLEILSESFFSFTTTFPNGIWSFLRAGGVVHTCTVAGEVIAYLRVKHSSSVFKRRGGGERIARKGRRRREKALGGAAVSSYVGRANRRAMGVGFSRLPVPPEGNARTRRTAAVESFGLINNCGFFFELEK